MGNKKIHIITFGCQMNVHDTERMKMIMKHEGYDWSESPDEADLILLNTCSVREGPENKVHSQLGRLKPLKESNKELLFGVTGCVAQQKGEELIKQISYLDLVVGTDAISSLPDVVKKVKESGKAVVQTEFQEREEYQFVEIDTDYNFSKFSDFVTIMKGCNKRCSYCIVPYVRGREISRPVDAILKEIEMMAERGVKEITLLGQTVNSYKYNGVDFASLLHKINEINGIERVRFTSPHPKYFTESVMDAISELDKVMEHIHYPLQSGSNDVLKHMRRQYNSELYLSQIEYMKNKMPQLEITTDIIVGYPTETATDFEETLKVMKIVEFDNSFSFLYSPRPMTPIYDMEDPIPEDEKKERLYKLKELQEEISKSRTSKLIGSIQEVLIEEENDGRDKNQFSGRSRGNRKVFIDDITGYKLGDIVNVKIISGSVHALKGEIVSPK
ncbi:tRNA (N6-isopentenyl adenosine(37)-C2)-methylthiotransferase MiaB [bacterium]|nr:tRNA (N6-isopentenyl adenosine(37)-C2)-methylthiotransferase MiaB [bacterium]